MDLCRGAVGNSFIIELNKKGARYREWFVKDWSEVFRKLEILAAGVGLVPCDS
jgi:hypothetical protein